MPDKTYNDWMQIFFKIRDMINNQKSKIQKETEDQETLKRVLKEADDIRN